MLGQNPAARYIPVLPTLEVALLPGVQTALDVGRTASIHAIDAAKREDGQILVLPQKDPDVVVPTPADLHAIGVLADIVDIEKTGPRRYNVTLRGLHRLEVDDYQATHPYMQVQTKPVVVEPPESQESIDTLFGSMKASLAAIVESADTEPAATRLRASHITEPEHLIGLVASQLTLPRDKQEEMLIERGILPRLGFLLPIIERMRDVLQMKASIGEKLSEDISRNERERVLRERLRSIKEELGEAQSDDDLDEYREGVAKSKMSDEARAAATRQLRRMSHMASSSPEYNIARTYIETLLDIPWGTFTEDTLEVAHARDVLDADHSGLEKVKKRILEFIAVRKLAPDKQGPILCLVGPPGVGKTSLGRSIARALNRKYVRAALGGVRDEAAIRGHRRTYIGALPGRIASTLTKAGSMNPVFVLDEIDKLGADHRGDPSSALLEVLDPEQNSEFSDHYLEVDLDLSKVMFVATANQLGTIPPPLLDRMEVIRLPGYTIEEKRVIATEHLWPKQLEEHGLQSDTVTLEPEILNEIIAHYTREAGVRTLERQLAALCRHAAVVIAGEPEDGAATSITPDVLAETLGPPRYQSEIADRMPEIGICTGLSWTPTGGNIMFIEARAMPGEGRLKLTGQLGDVMNESATAAFSWVRANADKLDIDSKKLSSLDIHLHLPSGAIKKDGPSAGVAMATALVSLLENKPVRNDVAITGELTLRGLSLPVGGIKEKVLAAHRAGIKIVLLPARNQKDLLDIPEEVQNELDIQFIKRVDDALAIALGTNSNSPRDAGHAA